MRMQVFMTKKQYQRYSAEIKLHALKRASEDGVTDEEICEELGMSRRQLRRWHHEEGPAEAGPADNLISCFQSSLSSSS
jgi:transposase-like protein